MKTKKQTATQTKVKTKKVFKPLSNQQSESVIGGPVGKRGTITTVQSGG